MPSYVLSNGQVLTAHVSPTAGESLLFSQFASMLDLIRPELDRAPIPFVERRGATE
jgi:SNF2 family DNA or RNA helicase